MPLRQQNSLARTAGEFFFRVSWTGGRPRGNEDTWPLLIACRQGPTVSVNLQVPAGTKASGLQQLLAAANGVDVSNDVTIKVNGG